MWLARWGQACSSACFLPMLCTGQYRLPVRVPVYTTPGCIRRNMSHSAYAYYSTESIRCRGTENVSIRYGTAWYAYRRGVYLCSLKQSYRRFWRLTSRERSSYIEKPRAGRNVWDVFITYMHVVRTYIVLDERLIDPWYLVSYYTVDSIGYKGRTYLV